MNLRPLQFLLALTLAAAPCVAESGYVTVLVQDAKQHPVGLAEIEIVNNGGSRLTKDDGRVQLPLAQSIRPTDWITFQLVHSPPGKNLAIVSPWDNRTQVPSFENRPENLIRITVVQRGDRAALESGMVLVALTAKINKANAPRTADPKTPPPDPQEALAVVAKQYGLNSGDIDTAIRAWGAKTTDPYEAGLAALYERNYPQATSALQHSLKQREQKLEADQKVTAQDQKNIADAAFFLGQSLYEQGNYAASVAAYKKCLRYRPADATVLNNLALSLDQAGSFTAAEPLFRQALALDEAEFGPHHLAVAQVLNNLAELLDDAGHYDQAEPLFRRALAINEKSLGPNHPAVAINLTNLAALLEEKGYYAAAEPLFRRALAIDEKSPDPDQSAVAADLNNLASLFKYKQDYPGAETLFRRALAIDEKSLVPDHPDLAVDLNNLALVLNLQGKRVAAEPLYQRALAIDEKALGPNHPEVATDLANLAMLLEAKGDHAAAEPLFRRALAIDEKSLAPNHPDIALRLNNLAMLLEARGERAAAEPLYRRALAIDEKSLGPNHPTTKTIRDNLNDLEQHLAKTRK
jgi:tetratricopeptide (TPR) repeat protein